MAQNSARMRGGVNHEGLAAGGVLPLVPWALPSPLSIIVLQPLVGESTRNDETAVLVPCDLVPSTRPPLIQ